MYRVEEVAKELNKESIQKFIIVEDGTKHLSQEGLNKLKGIKVESKDPEFIDYNDIGQSAFFCKIAPKFL